MLPPHLYNMPSCLTLEMEFSVYTCRVTKLGDVPVSEEEKAMILKERKEAETQYQVGACYKCEANPTS